LGRIHFLNPVAVPRHPPVPEPHVEWLNQIVQEWNQESTADAGLVGIPFDRGIVVPRLGARLGPRSIREVLYSSTTYSFELDADLSLLRLVDCGDIDVDIMNYGETHRRVEQVLAQVFGAHIIPLIVGGDHSLSYPCVKALCRSMGKDVRVGVIDFDAHLDCRADWKENHGLWVREIQEIEGGQVRGVNIVQIGIRGYGYSPFYRDYVKKNGMIVFTAREVKEKGINSVIEQAVETAMDGTDVIYVSVDIDALDQASAPGTSSPLPGGLDSWELLSSLYYIGKKCLVGALDLMEVSPLLDICNMTSRTGASVILNFLCGLTKNKAQTGKVSNT
jgi:formiminoglutamase